MGERVQELKDSKYNRNRLLTATTITIGALTLTACGSTEVSPSSTPNTDGPVATSTAHPGKTETSKPTETKTSTPAATETSQTSTLHGYEAVLTKNVPLNQSYMDTIPPLNAVNQSHMDMKVKDFVNQSTNDQVAVREAIAPDEIVQEWSKKNNSLPYTMPSETMTALQIANNFVALQEFGVNKVGISSPYGPGTQPAIDKGVVGKMLASTYYKPNGKTATGELTNGAEDFWLSNKGLLQLTYTQPANVYNSTVTEVKELGRTSVALDSDPTHTVPEVHMVIKGTGAYYQDYTMAYVDKNWLVTSHNLFTDAEQYSLLQGTIEKNPAS